MAAPAKDITIDTNDGIATTAVAVTGVAYVDPVESVGDIVGSVVDQGIAEAISNY